MEVVQVVYSPFVVVSYYFIHFHTLTTICLSESSPYVNANVISRMLLGFLLPLIIFNSLFAVFLPGLRVSLHVRSSGANTNRHFTNSGADSIRLVLHTFYRRTATVNCKSQD